MKYLRQSDFIFDTENQGVRVAIMNLTINNINTNPLATLLFRDGQGLLLAGLSLILRSRAIKGAWLQFREKDAPKPVQVIAGANIRRPVAGKNVIRAGGRPASLIVPAMARVLLNTGDRPSLGAAADHRWAMRPAVQLPTVGDDHYAVTVARLRAARPVYIF